MIVRDRRNRPHRHVLRRRVSWWSIGSVGGAFALLALTLVSRIPDDAPVAVLAAPPVAAAPAPSDGSPYVLAPLVSPVADPPDAVVTAPAVVSVAQVVHIAVPAARLVAPPAVVPDVPEHEARQVVESRPQVDTRQDVTEGTPDVDRPTTPVSHPQPVVDGDQDGDDTPPQATPPKTTPPKTTPPSQTPPKTPPPSQTSPPTDTSGSTTTPPAPPTNTPAPAPTPEHDHAPWDGWQDYWQHYVHGGAHHADPQD